MTGKLLAYHLKSPRAPLVVRVPQFENHWSTQTNIIVATSPSALRWIRGPPRRRCVWRTTPMDICGASKQQESDYDMWTLLLLAATRWSFAHMPLDTNRMPCFPHGPHFSGLYMHGGLTKRRVFSWICAHLAVFEPKLSDTVERVEFVIV